MKTLELGKSILELTTQYPELIGILKDLGFSEISNPVMLKTAGRIMTIPKGCTVRNINLETVKQALVNKGFNII